ncbi:MAG: YggT family protein [Anaerolineae bacterium]
MRYLSTFVSILSQVLSMAILARVLLSWVPSLQQSRLGRFIYEITEPILSPIRRIIPPLGMLDLSPFIAMVVIQVLAQLLQRLFV